MISLSCFVNTLFMKICFLSQFLFEVPLDFGGALSVTGILLLLQPGTVATYPHEFEKISLRPDLPFDLTLENMNATKYLLLVSKPCIHYLETYTMHLHFKNYRVYSRISHLDRLDSGHVPSWKPSLTPETSTVRTVLHDMKWEIPANETTRNSPLLGSYPFDHWRFAIHIDVRLSIVPWRWL